MTQGGRGTAAKAILTPWRLGRGYGEGGVSFRGGDVFISYLFSPGREARDSWFSSHSWRGGRSVSGGGSRSLALERVGADGSGSQSSRRSCGTPGTSGRCQARGLDPAAEGASCLLPLLRAYGFSPPGSGALAHISFGACWWGRLWEKGAQKTQAPFLGLWGGARAFSH